MEYVEASTESGRSLGLTRKSEPSQGASAVWRTRRRLVPFQLDGTNSRVSLSPRACARGQCEASARIVGTALAAPCIPGARFALAATGLLPCGNWTCLLTQLLGPATCSRAVAAGHGVRLGCIMRPPGQWDRPARRQTSDDIVCTTTARERHAAAAAPGQCNSGTRRRERTTLVPRLSTGWGAC